MTRNSRPPINTLDQAVWAIVLVQNSSPPDGVLNALIRFASDVFWVSESKVRSEVAKAGNSIGTPRLDVARKLPARPYLPVVGPSNAN